MQNAIGTPSQVGPRPLPRPQIFPRFDFAARMTVEHLDAAGTATPERLDDIANGVTVTAIGTVTRVDRHGPRAVVVIASTTGDTALVHISAEVYAAASRFLAVDRRIRVTGTVAACFNSAYIRATGIKRYRRLF